MSRKAAAKRDKREYSVWNLPAVPGDYTCTMHTRVQLPLIRSIRHLLVTCQSLSYTFFGILLLLQLFLRFRRPATQSPCRRSTGWRRSGFLFTLPAWRRWYIRPRCLRV
jgi:hypothetical protein